MIQLRKRFSHGRCQDYIANKRGLDNEKLHAYSFPKRLTSTLTGT